MMKLWTEVILEWLNCLDVLETRISDLKELDDGKFYQKLISLFSWKSAKDTSDTKNIIIKFLQDEYPEFKFNYNDLGNMEHIYIASLFLLRVSQEPVFYQPMCNKLQHETQLKIKAFFEMIIPYGKGINRETLREIIAELEDSVPNTPMTPKTKALKDFFNSPVARSAQIHKLLNERNQELRKLKTELEVERFEKSDLQEDLRIQQNKVQNLQRKLQEKSSEIKVLQDERNRQSTPQSCKKNKNTVDLERYYRREIDHLEDQLMQKQCEVDRLETKNDTLTKKLTCTEKQCVFFKEKFENCEKYLENIQMMGELKDRELINLRMTNEELRVHLKELSKTTMEQSFEIEGIAPLTSLSSSLNSSEVLSSVIEIQLQEAKEESASLKTQLDTLNKKFDSLCQDYESATKLLEKKSQILKDTETKSNITANKLKEEIESLQKQNESLIDQNKNLQTTCTSQKESLLQAEESKNTLNAEIDSLRRKIKTSEESLDNEEVRNVKLNVELAETRSQIQENLKCIQDLTDQINVYKASAKLYNTRLKKIISETDCIEVNNLDTEVTIQLIEHLQTSLHNFNKKYTSKEMEFQSLNDLMEETKLKVHDFQSQICKLKQKDEQNIREISKLKETIDQNVKEISELISSVEQYSEEIVHLKQVQVQKQNLEKDLCICRKEMKKKVLLLQSSEKCIQTLKTDLQTLITEFSEIKKYVSSQLIDCQKQHKESGNNILNAHKTLYYNYITEQLHRNKLEHELTDNKKELKDSKNLNITLENDLTKNKQILNDLELELTNTKDKLTQSVQELEKLKQIKETLEERQKNLKSENGKLLMNLSKTNSELKLSAQEVCNISDELKSKDEKLGNLITEITSLKSEKEQVLRSKMEEESEMKDAVRRLETELLDKQRCLDQLNIEMKAKEETLERLQNKLEKLTTETIVSEKKMKEVISNLQEVRTNQDAVLAAQEKALQEKCLIIEQLQKEFSESKNTFCKQLENEKLLCQNLQSTNSQLQIQSYKQTKTIEELQDTLRREKNELSKSKGYCQTQDTKKLQIVQACELLRHTINDLKLVITDKNPKSENLYADGMCNEPCADNDNDNDDEVESILNTIKTSVNEMQVARELILYLSNVNINLNETLKNEKEIVNSYVSKGEEYIKHLSNIIEHKDTLKSSLGNVVKLREDLDTSLNELKQKWHELLTKSHDIFVMDDSICDELKYIHNKKTHLENMLFKQYINHYQNGKPLHTILWKNFVRSEHQLKDIYLNSIENENMLDIFGDEKVIIEAELDKNKLLQKDISQLHSEVDDLSNFIASFTINFESNKTKFQSETEKLQLQINQLLEDKCNLQCKLDCSRISNTEIENEIEELKFEIENLKITSSKERDDLENELMQLKKENLKLEEIRNELISRPKKEDVDIQLKDIHEKYRVKLDEIKQNMKTAYNAQIAKLNNEQEQCVQERLELLQRKMESQCRKQADELCKYKAHVASMSTQIWNVGEKLLSEQQEKEKLQKELNKLKVKYRNLDEKVVSSTEHRSSKYEGIGENKEETLHEVAMIQEKTTYERRYSIRSIQTMGNAFNAEDEEEVFDNNYLADMKESNSSNVDDRLSILKKRNALCKPHLKSSYPAEMQFHPLPFSEEEIKSGSVTDEMFNDSLSQSLLPEQKVKKRDRTQISYKKPGPPTPSKNGGRLSLQGNELKSPNSRILKERNKDRATTTPRTLKSLFSSKRQDENTVTTTPQRSRRRSSIFRKYRGTNDR
uniref:putative leucine-rich repeat-containing protein DDB_G0290503 n=1 Tax=Osmia lignaria TaxID=473952 RepID=UPI0014784665|nr:putative leucine-rich repeat-containing protein DDB_G0290503 [Osmia lignaria]